MSYRVGLGPGYIYAEELLADGLHVGGDDDVAGQQADPLVVGQRLNDGDVVVEVHLNHTFSNNT